MLKKELPPDNLLAPVPAAIVTCGTMEKPNAVAVAWTGLAGSAPIMVSISLRKGRYSRELIGASRAFVLNLANRSLLKAVDYCGNVSGRDTDKLADCGLSVSEGPHTGCPMLEQSPVSLECSVTQTVELGDYILFLGLVEAVHVDAALLDGEGKVHLEQADLLAYVDKRYLALGETLGQLGFTMQSWLSQAIEKARTANAGPVKPNP